MREDSHLQHETLRARELLLKKNIHYSLIVALYFSLRTNSLGHGAEEEVRPHLAENSPDCRV